MSSERDKSGHNLRAGLVRVVRSYALSRFYAFVKAAHQISWTTTPPIEMQRDALIVVTFK